MYTEYQPSHLLVPYIDNYWEFKGNPDYGMRIHILPDGCTDFIFTLGEVANAVEEGSLIMQPYRSYFVGPMTKYSELVTYAESVHMFGVRFLPCGLSCFTNLPLHEFVNSRISVNEMKAVFDDTFIEKLGEQKHVADRIRVVEEYLLAYLARHYQPADSHVAMAVNMINHSGGKRSVRSLMDDVCLCQRHFERKFKHYIGFTPKEYSRIVKFKNAVELLRTTTSANLLTTAVDAGYYDLAHFSKEIKSMSRQYSCVFSFPYSSARNHTYLYRATEIDW